MDAPPSEDVIHSPLRYATSGAGCGCGCLGLLLILVAATGLAMIPLEMYPEGPGNAATWGILGVISGLGFAFVGGVAWIGSLFMD